MVSVENSSTDPKIFLTSRLGDVRAYSSSLASFTRQWKDLGDFFESIDRSIDDCFLDLQSRQKHVTEALSSSSVPRPRPELKYLCLNMDGKGLRSFLIKKQKEQGSLSIRDEVSVALLSASDPAMLVLSAVDDFYPRKSKSKTKIKGIELVEIRKTCVLLLEQLMNMSVRISPPVTAKAKSLALEWRKKISSDDENSLGVLSLLLLLATFELGYIFQEELFDLFELVALCQQASDLYRRFGLIDRIFDFIQNLITKRKQMEAIKFIYEFGLAGKFPPFLLLRAHLQDAKKAAKKICVRGNGASQSKIEAIDIEIDAVKAVISCVEDYKIECKYTSTRLRKRMNQLKSLKRSREIDSREGKDSTETAPPESRQQFHSKNKRFCSGSAPNIIPK